MNQPQIQVHANSHPSVKIALFRSLFRGREEVYPVRYVNRATGQIGYLPQCGNEWVRGICEKPRIKCTACTHQKFLPVTDEVIRWHLSGFDEQGREFVMGIFPLLLDETCFLLVLDLNKQDWRLDAHEILRTCQQMGLPVVLERSRSGNSGHIWLFFQEAIPAKLARNLGSHILTETMERRPEIGLDTYDRLIPNQDTLPRNNFGSLITLPLQKVPRQFGKSVFVDDQNQPYPDQWHFLSQVQKIERSRAEECVAHAEKSGRIVGIRAPVRRNETPLHIAEIHTSKTGCPHEPPILERLPSRMELILSDQLRIDKTELPAPLQNRLIRLAAFQNPEFHESQSLRLSTFGKPRIISCAVDEDLRIGLPRGCLEDVQQLLLRLGIATTVRDERQTGKPIPVAFHGVLRPEQESAAKALLDHDTGVLSATTAFGKTVIAAWLIAQRGVNVLILVHRRQLLEQWIERLSSFLVATESSAKVPIGQIGGGRKKPNGMIDVAVIQSLIHYGEVCDVVGQYGHVIIDECHHLSARTFEQVVRRVTARFVTGLTATVTRKDGRHPIILMQCGPIRYHVDPIVQARSRRFEHAVHVRPTGFRPAELSSDDVRLQFQDLYNQLIADESRNQFICDDVLEAAQNGRSPLVLTERNEHLDQLAARLSNRTQHLIVLRGGMLRKEIRSALTRLATIPVQESRVILATGGFLGEGFDDPRLDTLFLTLPISWHGTIAQYVGRLHRLHAQKTDVRVYDYADLNVPMLSRMFDRRCRGYEAIGYHIRIPGSAVPGWPADVILPNDPRWKTDYAATVRRLCLDGVGPSLANLFVQLSQVHPDHGDVSNHPRSITEAFLFHRLETLTQTTGRFRLNAELPIPFDDLGKMEVDLLCSDSQLVVELDGFQHLEDPEAYRRDRRKDALLQENGYFVLRFLAADVSRRLDVVLNTILRTLSHCHQRHASHSFEKNRHSEFPTAQSH